MRSQWPAACAWRPRQRCSDSRSPATADGYRTLAADRSVGIGTQPDALAAHGADKGTSTSVLFEASGNATALTGAFDALRSRAVIVQLGLNGDARIPINTRVAKELELRGTFRFHQEFALAVEMIGAGRIDVRPLLTAAIPVDRAVEAFELASDRSRAMKVQVAFG